MSSKGLIFIFFIFSIFIATPAYGMHIAEGFLPIKWSMFWIVAYIPFLVWGIHAVKKQCQGDQKIKMILALVGAFCFVLSALKIPSVTGSSSHPTGMGLGVAIFGPVVMSVVGLVVLLFQGLLLAHGGLSTLGANAFSMAVAGPFVGYGCFVFAKKCKASISVCVFLAGFVTDLFTYLVTSLQLALAFHSESVVFIESLGKFLSVFAVTQIPLAVIDGILAVVVYRIVANLCSDELSCIAKQGWRGK